MYACHIAAPRPAPAASIWQCASAPAIPPRLAPLPGPALVTKNVMSAGPGGAVAQLASNPNPATATAMLRILDCIFFLLEGSWAVGTRARDILGVTPRSRQRPAHPFYSAR